MSQVIDGFATRAADRVDADAVGFTPETIILIITTVLPLLMSCFKAADQSDPAEMQAEVKRQNERHPWQLQRRTAAAIRRNHNGPMSREQAGELADAVIEQILEEDAATVVAGCQEVGS